MADSSGNYVVRGARVPVRAADTDMDVTQATVTRLERAIREAPGHWLWMYKRWKTIPEGADPHAYPFYARPDA
jgi:lauroyl/myristoyl acyltransferase